MPKLSEMLYLIRKYCQIIQTLPRKLSYIRKDDSIIDDYKKYP